ncbi:unnamed protein product [Arabidopsis halleri]
MNTTLDRMLSWIHLKLSSTRRNSQRNQKIFRVSGGSV